MARVPSPATHRKRPPVRRPGSKENTGNPAPANKPQKLPNGLGSAHLKAFRGGRPATWQHASSPEDDGGTGGAGTVVPGPRVRGSRSRDVRNRSPSPVINREACDWLEENSSRLAIQTQKCLLIHRQLQELLSQGSPSAARSGLSKDEVSWQSKALSSQALEGAPLDLLNVSEAATSERRDKLRADLTLAEEDVNRLKEELQVEQVAGEQFSEALAAGTKVEIRRLKEEVSVLEVRIQDRLDTLRQLATQAAAHSPRWSPNAASPSSPSRVFVHSPVTRYNFGPKARSTSPPRQRATVPLTGPFTPHTGLAPSASRAVSVPMIAPKQAPTLIRVAAAAATAMGTHGTRQGAPYPLQQLDDVRHRVQAEFWSGTM